MELLLDYFDFMAAGDEEITRSATPRFALESTLIRLATLPKTLPVAELVERLERLEGKFLGAVKPATSAVQILQAPPLVSSSVAPPPQPSKSGMVNEGDSASVWQAFVAFVGKEKKFLASHLESAVALELPPGPLKIGVGERHHLSFLQDSDNLATLKNWRRDFLPMMSECRLLLWQRMGRVSSPIRTVPAQRALATNVARWLRKRSAYSADRFEMCGKKTVDRMNVRRGRSRAGTAGGLRWRV